MQDEEFTEKIEAHHMMFHVPDILPEQSYKIQIAAINACGHGPYSDPLSVTTSEGCQPRMPPPRVGIRGLNDVVITWEKAKTAVESYKVLFKNKDGSYEEHVELCDGSNFRILQSCMCVFDMNKASSVLGLNPKDLI